MTSYDYLVKINDLDLSKLSNDELAQMMIDFVELRDGARIKNSTWDMMVEAAKRLKS